MFVLFTGFISVIVSVMWPYSGLFCSICSAYADLGSLFLMYLVFFIRLFYISIQRKPDRKPGNKDRNGPPLHSTTQ